MPYIHRFRPRRDVIQALITAHHGDNVSAAARACGLRPQALHDILRGRREGREETLRALADGFEVPLNVVAESVPEEDAA